MILWLRLALVISLFCTAAFEAELQRELASAAAIFQERRQRFSKQELIGVKQQPALAQGTRTHRAPRLSKHRS